LGASVGWVLWLIAGRFYHIAIANVNILQLFEVKSAYFEQLLEQRQCNLVRQVEPWTK
jgi:hypothetical protein